MSESGDLEVAVEVVHVGIEFRHATVVGIGSLVRDNAVGLNKRSAELQGKRCNS